MASSPPESAAGENVIARLNDTWTVQPHGPLVNLASRLLTVEGLIKMPLGNFPRRMAVVGLAETRAAIWSPVSLREPEMRQIEALGAPAFLIVPGVSHRLDIRAWKVRYPDAAVVCAPGARASVSEAVPVDANTDILANVRHPPGIGARIMASLFGFGVRHPRIPRMV